MDLGQSPGVFPDECSHAVRGAARCAAARCPRGTKQSTHVWAQHPKSVVNKTFVYLKHVTSASPYVFVHKVLYTPEVFSVMSRAASMLAGLSNLAPVSCLYLTGIPSPEVPLRG